MAEHDDAAIEQLDRLYEQLPQVECQGHCWKACGPIGMSDVEHRRIRERGVDIPVFTEDLSQRWAGGEKVRCPALDEFHRCSVYEVRPLICRAWGVGRGELACPWGCTITGARLRTSEVLELIAQTHRIGGGDLDDEKIQEALKDPTVMALSVRFTCGERWLEPQIRHEILRVVADKSHRT